jgi:bifunctional non-homologous end joining protein LigD
MLATPGRHIPAGDGWTHEVKWDGIRVLADSRDGLDRFLSRNGNDITRAWPDLAVSPYPGRDLLVDGEVIALNEEGLPDFRVLQERMHVRSASAVARLVKRVPATFMVFDLLRLDGTDLTSEPLERRRELLVDLMEGAPWQVPTAYDDGQMLYEATGQQGLEGIVSKRLSSHYHFGERTPNWLKFAHRHRASYVVGGWRPQEGGTHLAALLVGEPSANGLLYRGRVGSGIGAKVSRQLTAALEGHERTSSPFAQEVPRVDALGTHWVDPVLVVDVEAHRLPKAEVDRLRQPAYKGIRPDLTVNDI